MHPVIHRLQTVQCRHKLRTWSTGATCNGLLAQLLNTFPCSVHDCVAQGVNPGRINTLSLGQARKSCSLPKNTEPEYYQSKPGEYLQAAGCITDRFRFAEILSCDSLVTAMAFSGDMGLSLHLASSAGLIARPVTPSKSGRSLSNGCSRRPSCLCRVVSGLRLTVDDSVAKKIADTLPEQGPRIFAEQSCQHEFCTSMMLYTWQIWHWICVAGQCGIPWHWT